MSAALQEKLRVAELAGRSPELAAFDAVASPGVRAMGWLLSIAIALPEEELWDLHQHVFPAADDVAPDAVSELVRWPFVQITQDGLRLAHEPADEFREEFSEREPEAFRAAHARLAQVEAEREVAADPEELWFARGRTAFYLAGFDQDASVGLFGETFGEPPILERTDARMWLSSLALRQAPLLDARAREVSFFRGFKLYVMNIRSEARSAFDAVLEGDVADRYQALSAHFAGVLRRTDAPERGIELLRQSVDLSSALDLTENEIMARHSLVTALIARNAAGDLDEADDLARVNLEFAQKRGDSYLIRWCRQSQAATEWLALTDYRRVVGPEAAERRDALVKTLRTVWHEGVSEDPETAVVAANHSAQILRDSGDVSGALAEVEAFLDAAHVAAIAPSGLNRLGKTVGSLFKDQPELRKEIQSTLERLSREQQSARSLPPPSE